MATYFIVILTTIALFSIYIIGVLNENLYESERVKLFAKANIIASSIGAVNMGTTNVENSDNIMQILAGTNIRCIISNSAYTVLYDTAQNTELIGKILTRDIIKTALGGEQASVITESDTGSKIMSVCVPIKQLDKIVGVSYLTMSVDDIDKTISYIQVSLFIFAILISVLIGMLSFGMSYIITSPLDEFIAVAKDISKGKFDRRVKVKGHNELSQLAEALNYMCDELETIEEKRHNFVSDASHELKTPLSTIKLICDSIVSTENPDVDMVKDFLGDLGEEVDRLTRIVERLLVLTKMDVGTSSIKLEAVSLPNLLNHITRKLTPIANEKSVVLYSEFETENIQDILIDYDKVWEAIYNITDNAIKYSPNGGFVKLGLEMKNDNAIITVEDNGPGIPETEKDRIFERFYRLDDSRARDTGGTGLGLAIAKEAVVMHGGQITVDGAVGVGSIFTIYLPFSNKII